MHKIHWSCVSWILTEVEGHANEDDEAEPGVKIGDEIDDGNNDVSDGGKDAEYDVTVQINKLLKNVLNNISILFDKVTDKCEDIFGFGPQQAVNGGRSSVDAPQNVSGSSAQVPAQRESVQVSEETHLHHPISVLLNPDPQERTHVTHEPRRTCQRKQIFRPIELKLTFRRSHESVPCPHQLLHPAGTSAGRKCTP